VAKKTLAQKFKDLYAMHTGGATQGERDSAKRKVDAWLKRHEKTERDILSLLNQAFADAAAAAPPPPPPPDPRDAAAHPFDDPAFNPASVVEGLVMRYATMGEHERVVYVLWVIFTHVHKQFAIAPRVALVSEEENSGKSILLEIARRLALRPNADNFSTGPALIDHIDEGPGTVCADEIDLYDAEGLRWFKLIWNTGHWYLAKRALMVKGQRKVVNLHAPMIAAGVGDMFTRTQKSRAYRIEMRRYTAETKPARDYYADVVSSEPDAVEAIGGLDAAYTYLRQWTAGTRLNTRPVMPTEIITRYADNARGLIAVADACGPEWGQRARAAVMFFMRKDITEHPKITIIRHGLVIFDALGVDFIRSTQFNRELKRLDLPDARWARYRGASNADYPHPLALDEQVTLLNMVDIQSARHRHDGSRGRGYTRGQFEEAAHKYSVAPPDDADVARSRLRLISTTSSD
jgi:hypothetical protein